MPSLFLVLLLVALSMRESLLKYANGLKPMKMKDASRTICFMLMNISSLLPHYMRKNMEMGESKKDDETIRGGTHVQSLLGNTNMGE